MLKRKTKKFIKKRSTINDDNILKEIPDEISMKHVSDYDFKKFVECDWCYLCNFRERAQKDVGSVLILIKNGIVLDIIGPVYKIYFESDEVHGETVYCQVISKNKLKIKHDYFKLAISRRKETVVIRPRNIFKNEFLYNE